MSFGLRSQLLIGLLFALSVSFAFVDATAIRLALSREGEHRKRAAGDLAQVLAASELAHEPLTVMSGHLQSWLAHTQLACGVDVEVSEGDRVSIGCRDSRLFGDAVASNQTHVRVYMRSNLTDGVDSLRRLLMLYTLLTGGTILILTYLMLTYWIVRPVDRVTRAAESLAHGHLDTLVKEEGAAEVARLARVFNQMSSELRGEKQKLESRLKELEQTTERLRSTQHQLVQSEKMASVGKLSAGIAHEIGNPLAAVLGMVELMQGGQLNDERRQEFLARIAKETQRINKIIRDLLDFARLGVVSEKAAKQTTEVVDIVKLAEETIALLSPQKDMRGVTVERRYHNEQVYVRASSVALTQVLLNLLLNAVDAIEGKGAIIVEIKTSDDDERALLRISDSGPGIAPEVIDTLFEPFVTTKPAGKGTGLGLSVCHGIIESLGGTITVSNAPSGGACFEITLPAQ